MMNTARNALEKLSADPEAQRLAEDRETGLLMHQHYMASAFEAGEAKERREPVRALCEVLGIEIDEAREGQTVVARSRSARFARGEAQGRAKVAGGVVDRS